MVSGEPSHRGEAGICGEVVVWLLAVGCEKGGGRRRLPMEGSRRQAVEVLVVEGGKRGNMSRGDGGWQGESNQCESI